MDDLIYILFVAVFVPIMLMAFLIEKKARQPIIFVLVGIAWAAISVNSFPMAVEMCKGGDVGKFTGLYYTFSMAAQIATPVLAGALLKNVSYKVLFLYSAVFVFLSFVTMCFVRHGDNKIEAKRGLEAFDVED